MNRGSAMKWAERLERTDWGFDPAQLRFEMDDGTTFGCPLGVLADFMDPNGWTLAWDELSMLFHGSQFYLPDDFRRKCKMKTDGDVFASMWSHAEAAVFVRENYEML